MDIHPSRRLFIAGSLAPLVLFAAVYLVLPRHGFMIDDFAWVLQSRVRSAAEFARLFTRTSGFYRPLVALTFAVDEWLFGNAPFGYGATNVALALGCGAAIATLARALGLGRGDDPEARSINAPNLEDAFGSMLNEAYELRTGRRLRFQIDVPSASHVAPTDAAMRLQLHDGRFSRLP